MNSLKETLNSLRETTTGTSEDTQNTWQISTFNPPSRGSYKFSILRQNFSGSAASSRRGTNTTESTRSPFNQEQLEALDEHVPCDSRKVKRTHVQHLPKWELEYVFSMCPQVSAKLVKQSLPVEH